MQALSDQFLACAALTDHKDRTVERRRTARPLDCVEEGQALTDELIGPLHAPIVGGKPHLLARCFAQNIGGFQRFYRVSAKTGKVARSLYSSLTYRA